MERDKHCISYITHFFPNWLNEGMTCEKVILLEKYKTYYFYPSTDKRDANNLYDLKQWKKFTRDILKFVDKE